VTRSRALFIGTALASGVVAGCGLKGPPLPPLRPVPVAPTEVFVHRVGDRVTLRLTVPATNADAETAVSISAVQIYARTLPYGSPPPSAAQLVDRDNLVGTIEVRPAPPPADESAPPGAAAPAAPAASPDPRPGPGETAVWSETITATAPRPFD